MRKFRVFAVLLGLVLLFFTLALPVSALTNEEMIKKLDEKFIQGEISEENYNRLRAKYGDTSKGTASTMTKPAAKIEAKPVQAVPGNLVKNGEFEQDEEGDGIADNWKPNKKKQPWVMLDEQQKHGGAKSLKIVPPYEYQIVEGLCQYVEIEPGKKYGLSFWAKSSNLTIKDAGFNRISFHDATGKRLTHTYIYDFKKLRGSKDWTPISIVATAPAGATQAMIRLGTYENTGTIWYDTVVLKKID